jgi:ribosomal protein S18 acetylase RimI-like enzyme
MRLAWAAAPQPVQISAPGVRIRELRATDDVALGQLMWAAFRGTADDDYAAPSDASADAAGTLTGAWGPVLWYASRVAQAGQALAAASIVVRDQAHQDQPLLAFALTDPDWQRRGLGRRLIEESIARLDSAGISELHLAVTRDNPATRLYERLGFRAVPPGGS